MISPRKIFVCFGIAERVVAEDGFELLRFHLNSSDGLQWQRNCTTFVGENVECIMAREIIISQTNGELTTTLPSDVMERLHVGPGDRLFAIETEKGIFLTPYDLDFEDAMEAFEIVRKQYHSTLRRLAE